MLKSKYKISSAGTCEGITYLEIGVYNIFLHKVLHKAGNLCTYLAEFIDL